MPHDDGLRSLRCCKRRSVVSDLRRFGHKWSSSRLRIAIVHASPIRSDPYSTFSPTASSSDMALAAAAGLALQGHSVTLYTSGYRQKDIPDYLWDTSAEIKTCLPRILRLALFSTRCQSPLAFHFVAVLVSLRVMVSCIVSFIANVLWSLLPQAVQRTRNQIRSTGSSRGCLDVVLCFETLTIPAVILSPLVHDVIFFAMHRNDSFSTKNSKVSFLTSTDDISSNRTVTTIYPPVVTRSCPLTPTNREDWPSSRPYFVALAWYSTFSDVFLAIESFAIFLSYHQPHPGEVSDEDDGCTGSTTILATPSLVIAGVRPEHYLLVLREANRWKLAEGVDFSVVVDNTANSMSLLLANSLGLIHTPSEVNEARIPCAAMLASRPVITTISFSAIEPVRHEATGLIVKTRSVPLIAQAIDSIFRLFQTRPSEWARMGARGKQRVLTEFSIEMFGSRLDDFLDSSSSSAPPTVPARTTSFQSGLSELASE